MLEDSDAAAADQIEEVMHSAEATLIEEELQQLQSVANYLRGE